MRIPEPISVLCPFMEEMTGDPRTIARAPLGDDVYCINCGATDHERI